MALYRRQKADEELQEEIDALEKEQNGEPKTEDVVVKQEPEVKVIDNKETDKTDWKKRYDDVRRFAQSKDQTIKSLEKKVEALEEQAKNTTTPPTSKEEMQEWLERYPKFGDIIRTLAREEAGKMGDEVKKTKEDLDSLKRETEMRRQKAKLYTLQPDWDKIASSDEFKTWFSDSAPNWVRSALLAGEEGYEDVSPDAELVSDAVDLFKVRTGWKSEGKKVEEKKTTDPQEVASSVKTPKTTEPGDGKKTKFKESEVMKMSFKEYERNEDAINEAIANGEFEYDLSLAQ